MKLSNDQMIVTLLHTMLQTNNAILLILAKENGCLADVAKHLKESEKTVKIIGEQIFKDLTGRLSG
jgi:hypothetical protein